MDRISSKGFKPIFNLTSKSEGKQPTYEIEINDLILQALRTKFRNMVYCRCVPFTIKGEF
jgi:hypothetical protein